MRLTQSGLITFKDDKNPVFYYLKKRCWKVTKGCYSIRSQHYSYRLGDLVWSKKYGRCIVKGINNCGKTALLENGKSVQVSKILKTYIVAAGGK